jgi:hypothetical protein
MSWLRLLLTHESAKRVSIFVIKISFHQSIIIMKHPFEIADQQIYEKKKQVDFDIREFSIEILVTRFQNTQIQAPETRKDLIWSSLKQSAFIESVILGIPILPLFVLDVTQERDSSSRWELLDGVQRVLTLVRFSENQLTLNGLKLLTMLNGKSFEDMSTSRQRRIAHTTVKLILFSKKSDLPMLHELAQRMNGERSF